MRQFNTVLYHVIAPKAGNGRGSQENLYQAHQGIGLMDAWVLNA